MIQVFTWDKLNDILSLHSNNCYHCEKSNYSNYNFYSIDNLDFLNDLKFEKIRFLNIYSIDRKDVTTYAQLKEVQIDYAFSLGLDNYLDFTEITINYNYYDNQVVNNFQKI